MKTLQEVTLFLIYRQAVSNPCGFYFWRRTTTAHFPRFRFSEYFHVRKSYIAYTL